MKTRSCDDCSFWQFLEKGSYYDAGMGTLMCEYRCNRGHKPRFCQPKSPIDENYGFKRKCYDFSPKATPSGSSCNPEA